MFYAILANEESDNKLRKDVFDDIYSRSYSEYKKISDEKNGEFHNSKRRKI